MIELVPAIDIIDGKCVRLSQGDYDSKKIYNESPVEVAKELEANGIRRLHVVDLDGADALRDRGRGPARSCRNPRPGARGCSSGCSCTRTVARHGGAVGRPRPDSGSGSTSGTSGRSSGPRPGARRRRARSESRSQP